ncbi:hypothetical protein A3SI_04487 [Nitritalea halalkaliphila LW7]|uniref:Alkaline phosphatase n=1 Tax=Nitritalea halalkaliphila LW7 TaxID=1189621 RepID=I5C8A0_9BACT|nr:hypothetical protein [Nitritalea halalkaliphila]EIM78052.1 hypothetical protein A3SI_04487 [Nitritalea halalkaliphila LW7]
MKRRDFFKNGFLTTLGLGTLGTASPVFAEKYRARKGEAKNIIFLVSDGMSMAP